MKVGFRDFLVCLAALAAGLRAPAAEADTGWLRIAGPKFVVLSHASEGATREVAAEVSGYEDCLGKFIRADPSRLKPLTIVLFASDREFDPYKKRLADGRSIDDVQQERDLETVSETGGGREWSVIGGVRRLNYSSATRRAILAGCAFWYIDALHTRVPLALRYGTVRMLSTFEEYADTAKFGRPIPDYLRVLSRWQLMPVEKLLLVKNYNEIISEENRVTFDAESWAFAHYLLFARGPMKRHAFSAFWAASKAGSSPHDALVAALGPEGAERIDPDLRSYFQGILFTVSLPFDHSGKNLGPIGAASPMEVEIGLAKITYVERPELALAHADAAIAAAPGRPEPYAMRADVLIRTEAKKSAVRHAIDAAMAHGSNAAWILIADDANRLAEAGGNSAPPAQIRAAVNQAEKAVMADHDYQPAFDFLAQTLFFADHVTADDGKFLAFGRTLYPDDRWLLVGQAALLRRQGDPRRADELEKTALARDARLDSGQLAAVGAYLAKLPR